jgi:hypothetical protein
MQNIYRLEDYSGGSMVNPEVYNCKSTYNQRIINVHIV